MNLDAAVQTFLVKAVSCSTRWSALLHLERTLQTMSRSIRFSAPLTRSRALLVCSILRPLSSFIAPCREPIGEDALGSHLIDDDGIALLWPVLITSVPCLNGCHSQPLMSRYSARCSAPATPQAF